MAFLNNIYIKGTEKKALIWLVVVDDTRWLNEVLLVVKYCHTCLCTLLSAFHNTFVHTQKRKVFDFALYASEIKFY